MSSLKLSSSDFPAPATQRGRAADQPAFTVLLG
jgi:hypothetical protein